MKKNNLKRKTKFIISFCFLFLLLAGFLITCQFNYEDEEDITQNLYDEDAIFNPNDNSQDKKKPNESDNEFTDEDNDYLYDDFDDIYFDLTVICNEDFGKYFVYFSNEVQTIQDNKISVRPGQDAVITVSPNQGYKVKEVTVISESNASLERLHDRNIWKFKMTDNMEVIFDFTNLEATDIFKGGLRHGITITELEENPKIFYNTVDFNAKDPGNYGDLRVMKITAALNDNGNGVQQSFALVSEEEIDLNEVTALSFWAKADKNGNIQYAGFGNANFNDRVVYSGETDKQQIPITAEWTRYIIPVPVNNNKKTNRVFFLFGTLQADNCLYIDNIEFLKSGVELKHIQIPEINNSNFYGLPGKEEFLKGAPVKLVYTTSGGNIITMLNKPVNSLKYNLNNWLLPFTEVFYSADYRSARLCVNIGGISSNYMTVYLKDGLILDNFEDFDNEINIKIPSVPNEESGYLWHTNASYSTGSFVNTRNDITENNVLVYSGAASGSWRANIGNNKTRGGRNTKPLDVSDYNFIEFYIKATTGTGSNIAVFKNINFTLELRNNGLLTDKNGNYYKQYFTYDADDWQKVRIDLLDYLDEGLDLREVTGYAFEIQDNYDVSIRVSLDDIIFTR